MKLLIAVDMVVVWLDSVYVHQAIKVKIVKLLIALILIVVDMVPVLTANVCVKWAGEVLIVA